MIRPLIAAHLAYDEDLIEAAQKRGAFKTTGGFIGVCMSFFLHRLYEDFIEEQFLKVVFLNRSLDFIDVMLVDIYETKQIFFFH